MFISWIKEKSGVVLKNGLKIVLTRWMRGCMCVMMFSGAGKVIENRLPLMDATMCGEPWKKRNTKV